MKSKLESLFVILIMLLSIANIKFCTDAIMRLNDNTEKTYITQGEIKSKQYLVTDEYISRISPKTGVKSFVMQLGLENKEIAIYEDKNKDIEVTEGLISTGMIMTVKNPKTEGNVGEETGELEGKDYELSVVGDINEDGRANIVEVVQIINHIVGLEGKTISGIRLISSDVNADKEINIVDINKLIRYIVFEELEIGEVGAPEEPVIAIEGQEKNGWYKEDTKVSILTVEEEFEKTIYSIDGEKFETTKKAEEKIIKQEGIHKITAYTYGTIGNKSLTAEREVKLDKQAPVIESINKSTQERTEGTVIIEIKANDELSGLDEEGYSFDGGVTWQNGNTKEYARNVEEIKIQVRDKAGNIAEETTSIENIVEPKPRYSVTFKNYDGTILQEEQLQEGSLPEYKGQTPQKEKIGYNCTFVKWDKDITEVIADTEYIATYTEEIINYTIIYELNGGILESENPTTYTVETETFKLNNPTREDYIFKGWTLNEEIENNEEVIIEKGSIGDRKYTANWKETNNVAKNKETGKKYESIKLALEEQEDGQTIIILNNVEEQVEIEEGKKVILDLNGKTISSSDLDIATLNNKGELVIIDSSEGKKGEINNTVGKAIVNETNAVLTMGNKEDEVLEGPYIEGEERGIENKGIFNFYDGTIRGKIAIEGTINDTPDDHNPIVGKNEYKTKQEAKLGVRTDAVAKMGSSYYKTLEESIEAAKLNSEELDETIQQTITILKNVILSNSIEIETYMDIKIDLNSYEISLIANKDYMINNGGKLEINDLSEAKTGKIVSSSVNTIIKNKKTAELNLVAGTILNEKKGTSDYSKVINNTGIVNIKGATISSNTTYMYLIDNYNVLQILDGELNINSDSATCIKNNTNAKLTIKGGNISTKDTYEEPILNYGNVELNGGTINGYYGIYNENVGTILMTGGTIKGTYGIYNRSKGKDYKGIIAIKIDGGSIESSSTAIYNTESEGKIEINGGTFSAYSSCVYSDSYSSGDININNAKMTSSNGNGISFSSKGNINIKDVTINVANGTGISNSGNMDIDNVTISAANGTGISNYANMNIDNVTINATNGNGVYNSSGKIKIKKGTIESNTTYGINNASGNIILGTNDKNIYPSVYPNENSKEEYPIVKGKGNGVYNKGKFDFYDGIIFVDNTSLNAINGSITGIEENSDVLYTDIDANETEGIEEIHYAMTGERAVCKILNETGNVITNANNEEITYNSINGALSNCQDGNTIKMMVKTHYIVEEIEIAEGKNIKLDLNGCKITTGNEDNAIINNGTFEILNSDKENEGIITTTYTKLLVNNNGKFTISGGTICNNESTNTNSLINNYGELIIQDGKLKNTSYILSNFGNTIINGGIMEGSYGLYNEGKEMIINGGKITAGDYGIKNIEGEIDINNGEIYSRGYYGVYNEKFGTIEITGGKITADRSSCTGVYNLGNLNISGGDIYADGDYYWRYNYYAYGIDNRGVLNIAGGNIKADGDSAYGVYNYNKGIVNINEVTITVDGVDYERGVYNCENAGYIIINGGTINGGVGNYSINIVTINDGLINEGLYNNEKGTININGGQINGGFSNSGISNIIGGTINSEGKGINNTGTLNLGTNDENTNPATYPSDEQNYPIVRGSTYGVYNGGTFNYYDGVIFANDTSANTIYGSVTTTADIYNENNEIAGKYDIIFKDETEHYAILGKDAICILLDSNGEIVKAENGETIKYYNLKNALEDCEESYTIKFIRTINFKESVEIDENKKVKIDLNGQSITVSNEDYFIKNNGNLEILDSAGNGKIITDSNKKIIENSGNLKINSGIINSTVGLAIVNSDNITIIGGEIKGRINNLDNGNITLGGNAKIIGIDSTSSGEINVKENASITATEKAINNTGSGDINIEGNVLITATSTGKSICNTGSGNINIEGDVSITATETGIENYGSGDINIEGNVSINAEKYGIYNGGSGNVNIKDNTKILAKHSGSYYYYYTAGIYNAKNGIVKIEKGTVTATGSSSDGLVNHGTAQIFGGTVSSSDYGIENTGILEVTDGTISGSDCGITSSGETKIIGGNITSNYSGIINSGTAEILGGNVEATASNGDGIENTGTLTLGKNDENVNPNIYPSQENNYPIIKGNAYGIHSTGTFNYYDGIIFTNGTALNTIYGKINDIADIYNENNETIGEYEVIYTDISADTTQGIKEEHYVMIGKEAAYIILDSNDNVIKNDEGNEIQYYSLNDAIENCQEGQTIQIIRNVNLREKIEIVEGKNIRIDLNGKTIINSKGETILNNGALEVLNSSAEGEGQIISDFIEDGIILNNATLIINGGTLKTANSKGITNSGDLEINGGKIEASEYGIYNTKNVKIAGGTVSASKYGIYSEKGNIETTGGTVNSGIYGIYSIEGNINVLDGAINASSSSNSTYGIYSEGTGNITVENGKVTARASYSYLNAHAIYKEGKGDIRIENGNITASASHYNAYGIYNENANKITVTGGSITASDYAIYNYDNGDILISGGSIGEIYNYSSKKNKIEITGGSITILDNNAGNVTITNGEITNYLENDSGTVEILNGSIKKIYNQYVNGTINISGGTFEYISNNASGIINIKGGSVINNSDNAVYNSGGIVNIGINDGEVLKDTPQIKSTSKYGIYNYNSSGRVNFYDGAIIGNTNAVYGTISGLPDGYRINSVDENVDTIGILQIYTLEYKGDTASQISINGIYFDNLQDAIDNCMTGQEVIFIEGNIIIDGEPVEIKANQTITINLNGFTISGPIINNGTLNIQNIVNGEQKEITEGSYGEITNNGTLNKQ